MRTNTGCLFRTQPPSLEFGRDSKAGGEVGNVCRGKKGRLPASSDHRLSAGAGSALARSRGPRVIGLGSLSGFLSLVPAAEWGAENGEAGSRWSSADPSGKRCTGRLDWLLELAPADVLGPCAIVT